ncbi:MAG: hypothetical protein D6698_11510 [Gammaproteobacteria bacterium]|nr:MAG: hypothetical protein D6698_11510 [Gammaproteobacteria bacterium]
MVASEQAALETNIGLNNLEPSGWRAFSVFSKVSGKVLCICVAWAFPGNPSFQLTSAPKQKSDHA